MLRTTPQSEPRLLHRYRTDSYLLSFGYFALVVYQPPRQPPSPKRVVALSQDPEAMTSGQEHIRRHCGDPALFQHHPVKPIHWDRQGWHDPHPLTFAPMRDAFEEQGGRRWGWPHVAQTFFQCYGKFAIMGPFPPTNVTNLARAMNNGGHDNLLYSG